jgi:uncharacterized phage protein (TIGR01671 family)
MKYSDNPDDSLGLWAVHALNSHDNVMQYSGLNDKTGKEIYEDDIVKHYVIDGDDVLSSILAVVRFVDGCYRLESMERFIGVIRLVSDSVEVIGNIHENPEILD